MATKSNELIKTVINAETGEIEVLPLTSDELAQREADIASANAEKAALEAELAAKAAAKAAILERLGLTEDEAKLLLA